MLILKLDSIDEKRQDMDKRLFKKCDALGVNFKKAEFSNKSSVGLLFISCINNF